MQTFTYEAHNSKTGAKVKAQVEAENEQAAAKVIRSQGLTPTSIKSSRGSSFTRFQRIRTKDKVLFSRQLSTLINAGLPLVQSLHSVDNQTTNKAFKRILDKIINDVEAGTSFSKAVAKYPKVFNRVYIAMVSAAEASGTLDTGLERLANQQEKDAEMISKVRGAMTYPIIVLIVMLGVVIFMAVKVLPEVENVYKGLPGAQLPFVTVMLVDFSNFLIHDWWIAILVVVIFILFMSRWRRTDQGRSVLDKLKMKAPPTSHLFMKMYMARFARTCTTLIGAGVPLLQVLEITGDSVNNVHIKKSVDKAIEQVKGGKALSTALSGDPNFLELVPNMLNIGEQSGAVETMMSKVADYYEKEVENEIATISTLIEPILMVVMGIIAIVIVAGVLLPIYGLANNAQFTNNG